MAATNYTPISLYYSATASNVPSASNLVAGELAINTADGKLFYKDSSNNVKVIAANVAAIANGGTGQTTATAAFNALAPSQASNSGKFLTTDGTNTSWATAASGTVTSVAVSGGTTGLTTSGGPITSSGTITLAGTLAIANGGTGASTLAGANIAVLTAAETFTGPQRGTITTSNTGSFDLSVTNNFKCTPTATLALTFTNHTAGQSGYVLLVNTGGYAVTAAATTKVGSTFLTTVSTAGTYLVSYFDDGTNAYVTASTALA